MRAHLIELVVRKVIQLYVQEDLNYVKELYKQGNEIKNITIVDEIIFIKRNKLAHSTMTDDEIYVAAERITYRINAMHDDIRYDKAQQDKVEHILDRQLTDSGIALIKNDWKAFYNNPEEYKDSVVIDMILQYLREVQQ